MLTRDHDVTHDNHLPTSECFSTGTIVQTRSAHPRGFALRNRGMDQTLLEDEMEYLEQVYYWPEETQIWTINHNISRD